jgi:hypothetical protein
MEALVHDCDADRCRRHRGHSRRGLGDDASANLCDARTSCRYEPIRATCGIGGHVVGCPNGNTGHGADAAFPGELCGRAWPDDLTVAAVIGVGGPAARTSSRPSF